MYKKVPKLQELGEIIKTYRKINNRKTASKRSHGERRGGSTGKKAEVLNSWVKLSQPTKSQAMMIFKKS